MGSDIFESFPLIGLFGANGKLVYHPLQWCGSGFVCTMSIKATIMPKKRELQIKSVCLAYQIARA